MAGIQGCNLNYKVPKKLPKNPISSVPTILPQNLQGSAIQQSPTPSPEVEEALDTPDLSPAVARAEALVDEQDETEAQPQAKNAFSFLENMSFAVVISLAFAILVLALGLWVVLLWLFCRFNFVLLDAVTMREMKIGESFRRHREIGNAYFKWGMVFFVVSIGAILAIALAVSLAFKITKGNLALGPSAGIVGGLLIVVLALAVIVISMLVRDFVCPMMYREKISVMSALNRCVRSKTFSFGNILKYILIILGLGIVAGFAQAIVAVVAAIGGLIVGGIVAAPGLFLIKAVPFLKVPLLIGGILLGVGLVFSIIVVIGMIMLPVSIFFRMFALTFLTRVCPDCDLLGFGQIKTE